MDELFDLIDNYADARADLKAERKRQDKEGRYSYYTPYEENSVKSAKAPLEDALKQFVFTCIKEYEEKLGCV